MHSPGSEPPRSPLVTGHDPDYVRNYIDQVGIMNNKANFSSLDKIGIADAKQRTAISLTLTIDGLREAEDHSVIVSRVGADHFVLGAFLCPEEHLSSPWLRVSARLHPWLGQWRAVFTYTYHPQCASPATVTTYDRTVVLNELKVLRKDALNRASRAISNFEDIILDEVLNRQQKGRHHGNS